VTRLASVDFDLHRPLFIDNSLTFGGTHFNSPREIRRRQDGQRIETRQSGGTA